jgi:PAS domain S-box-containing protein
MNLPESESFRDRFLKPSTEEELRRANQFINAILENIPDMIFVKDAKNLNFIRFNKAGEELLGYERGKMIGKNDYDFFPKQEADFFTSKDRAVLESHATLEIPEETIHTRFKGKRILHTKKVPIYNESGQPEYLLGISEDITEKKELEKFRTKLLKEKLTRKEAEKSVKSRDQFISIASHELKSPISSVKLQIQLASMMLEKSNFKEKENILSWLHKSERQIDHFNLLMDQLLDLSRITAGKLYLNLEKVDLAEVVRFVLDRFNFELGKKKTSDSFRHSISPRRIF